MNTAKMSTTKAQKLAQLQAQLEMKLKEPSAKQEQEPAANEAQSAQFEAQVLKECAYVMNLLSRHQRSRGELEQKLKARAVPEAIRQEVLTRASKNGLIDDLEFARAWVQQRSANKSLGARALRQELIRKAVPADIIETAIAGLDAEAEYERCRKLIRSKLESAIRQAEARKPKVQSKGGFRRVSEREKILNKAASAAARKGYAPAVAFKIAQAELDALGFTHF